MMTSLPSLEGPHHTFNLIIANQTGRCRHLLLTQSVLGICFLVLIVCSQYQASKEEIAICQPDLLNMTPQPGRVVTNRYVLFISSRPDWLPSVSTSLIPLRVCSWIIYSIKFSPNLVCSYCSYFTSLPFVVFMVLGLVYIVHSIICFHVCIFCTCGTGINFLVLSIWSYFISNNTNKSCVWS